MVLFRFGVKLSASVLSEIRRCMDNYEPSYLFHWLPPKRLMRFAAAGQLRAYWTHYLPDHRDFVRGISTTDEPMLWSPDDDKPREPCLILDRAVMDQKIIGIRSHEAYHLTKEIKLAIKAGKPIDPIIAKWDQTNARTIAADDEYFVHGPIEWRAVAALGLQRRMRSQDPEGWKACREIAKLHRLPVIDMTNWDIGAPGIEETKDILAEALGRPSKAALPAGL